MTATAENIARPASKIEPFPHHYEVSLLAEDGHGRITASPRPDILGGPPPQFGGSDAWWSPEHLLLSAVSLCLLTTFRALATARQLQVLGYTSRVRGILDKSPEGPAFTSIVLDVGLTVGEADRRRASDLLERAKQLCIVSHALKPPVDLRLTVTSS